MKRPRGFTVLDGAPRKLTLVAADPPAARFRGGRAFFQRDWTTALILGFVLVIIVAALATHLASCLSHRDWLFAIVGTLVSPIGVGHGIGIWFRAWG